MQLYSRQWLLVAASVLEAHKAVRQHAMLLLQHQQTLMLQ